MSGLAAGRPDLAIPRCCPVVSEAIPLHLALSTDTEILLAEVGPESRMSSESNSLRRADSRIGVVSDPSLNLDHLQHLVRVFDDGERTHSHRCATLLRVGLDASDELLAVVHTAQELVEASRVTSALIVSLEDGDELLRD